MFEFQLKVLIIVVMFVILFSITQNITPAETIQRIIDMTKQLWEYFLSLLNNNEPMDPYL